MGDDIVELSLELDCAEFAPGCVGEWDNEKSVFAQNNDVVVGYGIELGGGIGWLDGVARGVEEPLVGGHAERCTADFLWFEPTAMTMLIQAKRRM